MEDELKGLRERCAQLEAREARLRQIIDLVPDYIFATDEEGRFLVVNETLAAAYGAKPEQICGRLERDLTPDAAQSQQLLADNAEVLATNEAKFVPEQSVVDVHGRQLVVQIRRIPYQQAGSGERAVLGVATDISERKRYELALRQKERIEHDLEIARRIQRGLLPVGRPELEGFELAGWNRSADETGGDYFDWLTLPDGRIAISMGDVSGHGIGPALIVAVCRAYFRATASSVEGLAAIVDRVNGLLRADLPPDRFVTLVAGLLDPTTASLGLFSAGHGPILFYEAATGTVHSAPADDIPLGVGRGLDGRARTIDFAPGDMLVLITDGFHEWASPSGEHYGLERLSAALGRHAALAPDQLIAALCREVEAFAGGTAQQDDLTAVVLKRRSARAQ